MEQGQADKLAEIVAAADLSEREAAILALMLGGVNHYVQIAEALGVAPTVACTARTRLRRKLTIAAAEAEEKTMLRAQAEDDAATISSEREFYQVLIAAFHNRAPSNPHTPAFKNVRHQGNHLIGDEARVSVGTKALVLPEDLIREARKRTE